MLRLKSAAVSLVLTASVLGSVFIGCTQGSSSRVQPTEESQSVALNEKYDEKELGLRKSNLYREDTVVAARTEYTDRAPGSGQTLDRAFENAPPMIPHSTEGLLPITRDNNMCLSCHLPEMAAAMPGTTAIPGSHFASFRPKTEIAADGSVIKEGHKINNTSDIKTVVHKMDNLHPGRFNCSQCHAPQANVPLAVANEFEPEFRAQDANKKSNLIDILNEGVE